MAYNVLKGSVEGSVDQHADQEIGGVKVFRNTVSASVFYDTDAQSPCATIKDVAVTNVNGRTKDGILIYEDDGTIKTDYSLSYKNNTLQVKKVNATSFAGSGKELYNLPTNQFDGEISAAYLNYSNGLQNIRGALQIKTSDCLNADENGLGISLDAECGLWLKSNKLTLDLTKAEGINARGQNLSDDDVLLVGDISTNRTNNTTLKNLYESYISLKVPQPTGPKGSIQFKGNREFESSPKLNYDVGDNTLKVEGNLKSNTIHAHKKLVCHGAVYYNITKTSDAVYQVMDDDYTILCDSSNNKVKIELPPPCNSAGRVLVIKKVNTNKYKINSNEVVISCEESKIDITDTVSLKMNYSTRTLQSDGDNWLIIQKIG